MIEFIPIGRMAGVLALNKNGYTKYQTGDKPMRTKKYCGMKSDIPKEDHFAILEFSTIHIPGDERSRTHPGHGYPESTENVVRYIAFLDKEEWEQDIKSRLSVTYGSKDNFTAIKVSAVQIQTSYNIDVK